ncbi:hypothetical protein [Candidatus Villigracilis affinis]|uniref:hypothetical protein n=1 Tax=Candidatus Villigracilis affinis TaxID=3140682 RepID=UPI002A1F00B0|nr:hypothetical protein [Anaerolineales bacterium]
MENQEINADYLKECFINARQEFMFRVSHRDDYLKIHLLLQAILLALSSGIKISGVEIDTPNPDVLALAVPLAIVFSALYYSDNTLIAQLSAYLRRLDTYKNKSIRFENWDSSIELQKYVDRTFLYRLNYTACGICYYSNWFACKIYH